MSDYNVSERDIIMRKRLKLFICLLLAAALISGCGQTPGTANNSGNITNDSANIAPENNTAEPQNSADDAQNTVPEPQDISDEPANTADEQQNTDPGSHYTFKTKIYSCYYEEIYGEDMREAWFNLVDAVMAGEDSFKCKDDHTYNWVMGQFPSKLLPPLYLQIYTGGDDPDHPVKDGVGYITYLIPKEELAARITSFAELVEGILNEVFKDDYSDFEKAFTLYQYFTDHYTYDYDAAEEMKQKYIDYTSAYRLLTEGTGICSEIAPAYAYLLMQAGVDAGNMGGNCSIDGVGHDWGYVRINGQDYHVDPTYAIGDNSSLAYFMMTTQIREDRDCYPREKYALLSNYAVDHPHPEYSADDDRFSPLWDAFDTELDHASHTIKYKYANDYGETLDGVFDYSGY